MTPGSQELAGLDAAEGAQVAYSGPLGVVPASTH